MRHPTISNVLAIVTAGSLARASSANHPHHANHHNVEQPTPEPVKTVSITGPTLFAYELNGHLINEEKNCQGLQEGSLEWTSGAQTPPVCSLIDKSHPGAPIGSVVAVQNSNEPMSGQSSNTSSTGVREVERPQNYNRFKVDPMPSFTAVLPDEETMKGQKSTGVVTKDGLDEDFPDGTIDCSTFPSAYGPVKIDWAELGGWSGIQYVTFDGHHINNINTAVPNGEGCKPGSMCSYACPPGYQKSQWPSIQGANGQSVGGLECGTDGKLRLTNSNLSKRLCIPGTGATVVENKLSNNAAICRTDYPGTENEVVPLNTQPDTTSPLTCPDANTYFKHKGKPTSAQYYINNQGIPVQKACIWGSDGTNMGNWAPSYLGVGQDTFGKTFLAIASTVQNHPTNYKPLNYTVAVKGHVSGNCRLRAGRYCSGSNFNSCNDRGCTVELLSGQATFVLYDD